MSATTETPVTSAWGLVATGPVAVTLTFRGGTVADWAVTDDANAPAIENGHAIRALETLTMDLSTGERLWMRGRGVCVKTEDVA
jgi:hypothetical protein